MNYVKVIAPATVSNLGCGFDILGFALALTADEINIKKNDLNILRITKISGYANLPLESNKNVATVAVQAMLNELNITQGFDFEINKKIKPGSGIGSSAASSAAAVVGVNKLLESPYKKEELVRFVMKGEELASGSVHADNAAPAIMGNIILIRSNEPLDLAQIPVPRNMYCILLHPQIEIKTIEARAILKNNVELKTAIQQWGNVAGLISGLYQEDYDLIGRSLEDHIIEPQRSKLIKGYDRLKQAAINAGALGCNISGSGPSVFALVKGMDLAKKVKICMEKQFSKEGIDFNTYLSAINKKGVEIIEVK